MNPHHAAAKPEIPGDDNRLTIDLRQDWTHVSIGLDFRVTASIVAGRILVTRSYGFASTEDIDGYLKFILKIMADSLIQDQPYAHVMDWSDFRGSSIEARNKFVAFQQSRSQLRGVVVCGASALMRMTIRISVKLFSEIPSTKFCPDLDKGIQVAGNMLQLTLPEDHERPPVLLETDIPADPIQAFAPPKKKCNALYAIDLSNGHRLEFQKIGTGILLCRIRGTTALVSFNIANILKERHRAVLHCMDCHAIHVEIWDCSNFNVLFSKSVARQFFKTLFNNARPLLGCILLDTGHRIRTAYYSRLWGRVTLFPVRVSTSLMAALLQAQEYLINGGRAPHLLSPQTETHPEWTYDDGHYCIENHIVDGRCVHTICRGTLSVRCVERSIEIVRPLAKKLADTGNPYYMITDIAALSGGSYRARKTFTKALRRLYRDDPFRMYVFCGAKGTLQAGINIARHKVPFRILLTDDFQGALAAIQADQYVCTHLAETGKQLPVIPARQVPKTLRHYADDILHYLGTVNWEPYAKPSKAGYVSPNHPFVQVFEAIDLIKEDLAVLYAEQQKAAQEQLELEAQLARSRKMEALGLMAGGVAHDLNNVLSGIVTYPDMMLMEVPKNSALCDPLERVRDSGQKAAAIVQDLLTLARRGVTHTTTLNINTLVDEYLCSPEHQALSARYPDITLKTVQASDLMNIRGSAVHLKKTIMNLVYNAFEASCTSNSVELVTENRHVDRALKGYDTVAVGDYVMLHVIDHGTGIATEDLPRIFEPFYTKKKMGRSGTGLGMAVVWSTSQDHNGHIDVKTAIGEGTTFSLYFPARREKIETEPAKEKRSVLNGHGELILVVDDDKEQRDVATAVLSLLNYRATTANSGEAALALLKKDKVDLVLLDMIMDPGIDGLETLQRIRHRHRSLPVIITTGYSEDERLEKVRKLSGDNLIRKPYTVQTLSEALFEAMREQL